MTAPLAPDMAATLPPLADALVALLLVIGALFVFLGALGLVRFDDFYSRLHAPTKAATLGVGATLAASAVYFTARGALGLRELLVVFFLGLTAPVGAHLMVKAALHRRIPSLAPLVDAAAVTDTAPDGDGETRRD